MANGVVVVVMIVLSASVVGAPRPRRVLRQAEFANRALIPGLCGTGPDTLSHRELMRDALFIGQGRDNESFPIAGSFR